MRIKGKVTTDESAVTVHYRRATSGTAECFRVKSDSAATRMARDEERGRRTGQRSCENVTFRGQNMWCEA